VQALNLTTISKLNQAELVQIFDTLCVTLMNYWLFVSSEFVIAVRYFPVHPFLPFPSNFFYSPLVQTLDCWRKKAGSTTLGLLQISEVFS